MREYTAGTPQGAYEALDMGDYGRAAIAAMEWIGAWPLAGGSETGTARIPQACGHASPEREGSAEWEQAMAVLDREACLWDPSARAMWNMGSVSMAWAWDLQHNVLVRIGPRMCIVGSGWPDGATSKASDFTFAPSCAFAPGMLDPFEAEPHMSGHLAMEYRSHPSWGAWNSSVLDKPSEARGKGRMHPHSAGLARRMALELWRGGRKA